MATKSEISHKNIGQKIREARETIGFTQQELGEKIGKTGAAIGYIERGERGLDIDDLIALSQVLNVPLKFFFQDQTSETILLQETLYKLHTNIEALNQTIKTQQANLNLLTKSLPRSEELRLVTQSSIDPMLLIEKSGTILFCTKSIFQYTGIYHSLLKGKNFLDFIPQHEQKAFSNFIKQVFKEKKVHDFQTKIIKNQNKTINIEINAQLINKDGQLVIHLIIRDISYRKKIQEKLAQKEIIYRNFLEQNCDGLIITNQTGTITFLNKALASIVEIKKELALNKKIWLILKKFSFPGLNKISGKKYYLSLVKQILEKKNSNNKEASTIKIKTFNKKNKLCEIKAFPINFNKEIFIAWVIRT